VNSVTTTYQVNIELPTPTHIEEEKNEVNNVSE
jgi:hypothetical protein